MQLYNSLSGRKETFEPLDGHTVRMYVCGVTPYDTTHMGHAMTYVTFDVLNRACQLRGWRVKYVQNVTDIDDDIIRKARELGEPWDKLGDRNIRQFQEDLNTLNVLPPAVYPRATEEIPTIIDMVARLVEEGKAYVREGNVYFRVASDPEYGELCRCDRETMIQLSAERGADPTDPRKEDPLDFILWQASQPGEPAWESPWGPGRPGWHIECSAMSMRYLGPQLDVHGGGADLIYPHHESEIAQSEAYSGKRPFARFWVHVAMVRYQGEKMSKSLGNLVLVRDVARHHTGDAIRLYLLSHHYRESFEYEDAGPAQFEPLVDLLGAAANIRSGADEALDVSALAAQFQAAIDDDLDTPAAIRILREMGTKVVNAAEAGRAGAAAQAALRRARET
ncbi:MAG: cysteine--tRNA ligase, partial [Thermomicrobiaceae bacterium]|nr:cysteine--tRNA ligase [Thermomicrobiaceae bacterium]